MALGLCRELASLLGDRTRRLVACLTTLPAARSCSTTLLVVFERFRPRTLFRSKCACDPTATQSEQLASVGAAGQTGGPAYRPAAASPEVSGGEKKNTARKLHSRRHHPRCMVSPTPSGMRSFHPFPKLKRPGGHLRHVPAPASFGSLALYFSSISSCLACFPSMVMD